MYLRLFEVILSVLIVYVIASQVLLPAVRGTKLFPWFRRETKLLAKIAEANQEIREKELADVLKQHRDAALDTQPSPDQPTTHTTSNKE